jgi:hypothetical protein
MRNKLKKLRPWFIGLNCLLIFGAIQLSGCYIFNQTSKGVLCLWPYLAFVVLIFVIFAADFLLFCEDV